jgi:hypothetical protein
MLVIISLLIIILIKNNSLVFTGATTGLMLWFYNIIPLLLPFMLLSKLLVCSICHKKFSGKNAVLMTLLAGILCGYPIGAYTIKNSLDNKLYSKSTAGLLLPLCNNASPMFISGFVIKNALNNSVSLPAFFTVLYLPYVVLILISVLCSSAANMQKSESTTYETKIADETVSPGFDMTELIYSINSIGVYIILCSVAAELLLAANSGVLSMGYINESQSTLIKVLLSSIEITRGIELISGLNLYSVKKITALILALTSFGGISSILQTKQVIQNSGLSLKKYIIVKLMCGCLSYILACILPL